MIPTRLKQSDLQNFRAEQLSRQNGLDPVILKPITAPCVDHSHERGFIRMVLQREVNAAEGRVWNTYRRYIRHLGVTFTEFLQGLLWYHQQDFSANPLHPTFRDAEEKRVLRNKRARLKRKKEKSK